MTSIMLLYRRRWSLILLLLGLIVIPLVMLRSCCTTGSNAEHPMRRIKDVPPQAALSFIPTAHATEKTPLFIGFSQNWLLLQQTVVSYITAGWPPSDIYVVDNSGTMFSNSNRQLTPQNPAFLDYHRLKEIYQVNVIITPTLLSFSQLQNFYLFHASDNGWSHYFWSHQDVVVLSESAQSLYSRVLMDLRSSIHLTSWAVRLYAYDWLTLVSVSALQSVGGWDTFIPYYPSDCDMYERLSLAGFRNPSPFVGLIFDVATAVEDLNIFYTVGDPGSASWMQLNRTLTEMMFVKSRKQSNRNTWQQTQNGGVGEPFFYNLAGAQRMRLEFIELGRKAYKLKWGTKECRLESHGRLATDQWSGRWNWW